MHWFKKKKRSNLSTVDLKPRQNYLLFSEGSALISALFIMTLVAIAATAMSTRMQLEIYRTQLSIESDKLYLASQAVVYWAFSELSNPKQNFSESVKNGKLLDFPKKLNAIYPAYLTTGALYDLQSRFNLNNVADQKYHLTFMNFLKNTTNLPINERGELGLQLRNWLSKYQPGQNTDFYVYYMKQKPPYYPAQLLMQNLSEFRLIRGVSAKLYRNLLDFTATLPEITPININTASKPLLMSLGYGLSASQAEEILEARGKKGFPNYSKINPLLKKLNISNQQVTIESEYFLVIAQVSSADLNFSNYVTIKRKKDKKGNVTLSILNESFNAMG